MFLCSFRFYNPAHRARTPLITRALSSPTSETNTAVLGHVPREIHKDSESLQSAVTDLDVSGVKHGLVGN